VTKKREQGSRRGRQRTGEQSLADIAIRFNAIRLDLLEAGAFFGAAQASIYLVLALARLNAPELIQDVVDDLRYRVREARRDAEVVFALYHMTHAVARGEATWGAAQEAMERLRRCRGCRSEELIEWNDSSGTDPGAGRCERRSSMKTQLVQELKSERVQEELLAEEPYRISLKSERVQAAVAAGGAEGKVSSVFEVAVNQMQPVTIDLLEMQAVLTLYGAASFQAHGLEQAE